MGDSEIFHVQLLKMLMKNDPGNYDNFILVHIVTAVPGTSIYTRLAQLLFPTARLVAPLCISGANLSGASTGQYRKYGKYVVIDAKSFLTVEMTLNMRDVVK